MITDSRWNQEIAENLNRNRFVFFHRQPIVKTTFHRQPGYEIDLVVEGAPTLQIQEQVLHLKPHDIVVIRGECSHGFQSDGNKPWRRSVICFDSPFLETIADDERSTQEWLGEKGYFHISPGPVLLREIEGVLTKMSTEERVRGTLWQTMFMSGLASLWARLRRHGGLPLNSGEQTSALIRRAMDHVYQNYHDDMSLQSTARALHVSPEHLTRTFRGELGLSFGHFLRQVKLERARQTMLEHPEQSLTEIAMDAGFQDSSSFARAFKRQYSTSPSEYRKHLLNGL